MYTDDVGSWSIDRSVALRWSVVVGRLGDVAFAVSSLDNCDSGNDDDDNNDDDVGDINGF